MLEPIETLSKLKYSDIGELLKEAKKIAVDNDWLQICIEGYLETGKDFYLEVIIDAVNYKHRLESNLITESK